jgi:hypothetical protein
MFLQSDPVRHVLSESVTPECPSDSPDKEKNRKAPGHVKSQAECSMVPCVRPSEELQSKPTKLKK